jgi:hypothetical protein
VPELLHTVGLFHTFTVIFSAITYNYVINKICNIPLITVNSFCSKFMLSTIKVENNINDYTSHAFAFLVSSHASWTMSVYPLE